MTHLQQAFFFPNDLSEIVRRSVFCEEAGCLMLFPGQDVLWVGVSAELPRLPRTGGMLIPTAASKDVRYRSLFLLHPPHPRGPLSSHHSFPSRQKALLVPSSLTGLESRWSRLHQGKKEMVAQGAPSLGMALEAVVLIALWGTLGR